MITGKNVFYVGKKMVTVLNKVDLENNHIYIKNKIIEEIVSFPTKTAIKKLQLKFIIPPEVRLTLRLDEKSNK